MYARSSQLVRRKLWEYMGPSMLIAGSLSFSALVDSLLVGNLLGGHALAALGLASPVLMLFEALCAFFAGGGITLVSKELGRRNIKEANRLVTLIVLCGTAAVTLVWLPLLFGLGPICRLLGGGDAELTGMVSDYLKPLLFYAPLLMLVNGVDGILQIGGRKKDVALLIIGSNTISLVLDYVFIKWMNLGMFGAGLAGAVGNMLYAAWALYALFSSRSQLRMVRVCAKDVRLLFQLLRTGLPSVVSNAVALFRPLLLNALILASLGSGGMTAMALCQNVMILFGMIVSGINDAYLPVISVIYGDQDVYGVRQCTRASALLSAALSLALCAALQIWPREVARLFGIVSPQEIAICVQAIRLFSVHLVFAALVTLLQNTNMVVNRRFSCGFSIALDGAVCVLAAFLLNGWNPSLIWLCYLCASVSALGFLLLDARVRKKARLAKQSQDKNAIRQDFSVQLSIEEAQTLSSQFMDWCRENHLSDRLALRVGIAMEEMAISTIQHAHRSRESGLIDILAILYENRLVIRFRDNGEIFNPLEYRPEMQEASQNRITDGVELIKKLASHISYNNIIGFNITVLTFQLNKD